MDVIVKAPQGEQVLVDKDGRLTLAGMEIFDRLIKAVQENQTAIDGHEARLVGGGL